MPRRPRLRKALIIVLPILAIAAASAGIVLMVSVTYITASNFVNAVHLHIRDLVDLLKSQTDVTDGANH